MTNRYSGKPFLKLVDCFVLKCIGELDPASEAQMDRMTPMLQQTYGHDGSWMQIVQAQLGFPEHVGEGIRELWVRNQEIARRTGVTLEPMDFVVMFVDKNIPVD